MKQIPVSANTSRGPLLCAMAEGRIEDAGRNIEAAGKVAENEGENV